MTIWNMSRFGWQALDQWIHDIDKGIDSISKDGRDILAIEEISMKDAAGPIWQEYTECDGHIIVHNDKAGFTWSSSSSTAAKQTGGTRGRCCAADTTS